ncbi:hypothetical protein [Desertibacillus haloalkaliphilus]|uniref:hypothetical protein n=1 Tax=Desertibacillus haloalkaliphilus TaxID=1328930 RepID=UPI001C26D499|nr:hypothetical protein [Desertibacillus haloalkaliphilus]MBU8905569.1 hypothetical protein [Desertibacillus haloalkaliphilus]
MAEANEVYVNFPDEMKVYPKDEETIFIIHDEDRTEETIIETDPGNIHITHQMTLGDVVISTLLASILIFMILNRIIRR